MRRAAAAPKAVPAVLGMWIERITSRAIREAERERAETEQAWRRHRSAKQQVIIPRQRRHMVPQTSIDQIEIVGRHECGVSRRIDQERTAIELVAAQVVDDPNFLDVADPELVRCGEMAGRRWSNCTRRSGIPPRIRWRRDQA